MEQDSFSTVIKDKLDPVYYFTSALLIAMFGCGLIGLWYYHKTNGGNLFDHANRGGCVAMITIASLVILISLAGKIRGIYNKLFLAVPSDDIVEENKSNIIKIELSILFTEMLFIGIITMLICSSIGLDYFLKTGQDLFKYANKNACIAMIVISALSMFLALALPLDKIASTIMERVKVAIVDKNKVKEKE